MFMVPYRSSKGRGGSMYFICAVLLFLACCGAPDRDRARPPFTGPPPVQTAAAAKYDISVIAVERSSGPADARKTESIYDIVKDDAGSSFEDEMVAVTWKPGPVAFGLKITNKTQSRIRVIWDEARFIDGGKNTAQRMLHSGFGYEERNLPQPPALVPAGGVLNDFMHPADNFRLVKDEGSRDGRYSYWVREPFLPDRIREIYGGGDKKTPPGELVMKLRTLAQPFIGRTYYVILPLEVNGARFYYSSLFRVDGVEVTETEVKRPPDAGPRDRRGMPPGKRQPFSAAGIGDAAPAGAGVYLK
jgi:hypothetical protein